MVKIFKRLGKYKLQVFLTVLFIACQGVSELALPTLMSDMVDKGMMTGDTGYVLGLGKYMVLVAVICTACAIGGSYFASHVSMALGRDLRNEVFEKVESMSVGSFEGFGTASLITRTTNDVTQIQNVTILIMRMGIFVPVMCIGAITMALMKDVKLTLILAVMVPLMLGFMFMINRKVVPLFKIMQKKIDLLNLVLRENLTGIRVIRAFNKDESERKRFDIANGDLTEISIKANKIMSVMMPVMTLLMNIGTLAVTWFGCFRVTSGDMQVGDVMAFIQYALHIMISFMFIGMIFILLPRAGVSAERINEVLEYENDGVEVDADGAKVISKDAGEIGDDVPAVEFSHVTFSYPGSEIPALSDISFTAKRGQTTAIIGGTGSGKSTMIKMVPRFFRPTEGNVYVNGIDISEVSGKSLRAMIGYVPQSPVLFSGTVTENIRYGKEDASLDEVKRAADSACASEFVETLPEGYDSYISQGGKNLSGGQKQRLSIARALVRKPAIYVFDDSFSALDFKTDAALRASLKRETGDSAVLIVAQRVSTVMDADKIIVLDEGRVAGTGTHRELMDKCDVYREIVLSQLSEEEAV